MCQSETQYLILAEKLTVSVSVAEQTLFGARRKLRGVLGSRKRRARKRGAQWEASLNEPYSRGRM